MPRDGGGISRHILPLQSMTMDHISNFTPRAPHAPPAWSLSLPGSDPLIDRRSFGSETPKVPRRPRDARGIFKHASAYPSSWRRSEGPLLTVSATGLVPAFSKHHTRRVIVISAWDLRTITSEDSRGGGL